jgi:hypothetical protein
MISNELINMINEYNRDTIKDEICGHCVTCKWWVPSAGHWFCDTMGVRLFQRGICNYNPQTIEKNMCDFCGRYEFFEE